MGIHEMMEFLFKYQLIDFQAVILWHGHLMTGQKKEVIK